MTDDRSPFALLAAAYRRDPREFLAEPLQLRLWVHGGEPGSPSDAVTVSGVDERFSATWHRVRFDFSATPPQRVEEIHQVLSAGTVRSLLDQMLGGPLFQERFAEEDDHDMADLRQERWELQRGAQTLAKTFHEPFPQRLAALRQQFADCVRTH